MSACLPVIVVMLTTTFGMYGCSLFTMMMEHTEDNENPFVQVIIFVIFDLVGFTTISFIKEFENDQFA